MQQILHNMALILLNDFVRDNNIARPDCGTYCVKDGRGFSYKLVDATTGQQMIARVTFHKSMSPTFQIPNI